MNKILYSESIHKFQVESEESILGKLVNCYEFVLEESQKNAWKEEIQLLKDWLKNITGQILLEYRIPRMGKRVDCVLILGSGVFVMEFKVGEKVFKSEDKNQVLDYALDLKNFHKESHNLPIIPILVCTASSNTDFEYEIYSDYVFKPILTNGKNLSKIIETHNNLNSSFQIDPVRWENSEYHPTPTIIEAAKALYRGHSVHEISRSDAGANNLSVTTREIGEIIEFCRKNNCKSICFLTGVPGAGKTLAGLNLASSFYEKSHGDHAVFLSGNGPLVEVLREALARDKVEYLPRNNKKISKKSAIRDTSTFIQNIHHFRDDGLRTKAPPSERVVVFDEAQRAWDQDQTASFMKRKKGILTFTMSEPEFLISYMDRHVGWATIVCLVGNGQEINTGEAGICEWFRALDKSFRNWSVFASDRLFEMEGDKSEDIKKYIKSLSVTYKKALHLSVSLRSFRSEQVSSFIKALLSIDVEEAKLLFTSISSRYPVVLTRSLDKARKWIKEKSRGTERYGLVASSGGIRLRPEGINVKAKIDPKNWFLNNSTDVRSSFFMEEVATEFDIQGMELDWTLFAWDADLRLEDGKWKFKEFKGSKWQEVKKPSKQEYLINAYRVLLTRARQGMVLFVPKGNANDSTRLPEFYDSTYEYLISLGIPEI